RKPFVLGDVALGLVLRAGALSFVARGAIFAIWLLVPFYLVDTRGLGAFAGGIFFMLTPLGTTVAAPLGGRLADRLGPAIPAVAGLALEAAGPAVLGFVDATTSLVVIALALFVAGFGLGLFEVPNMATIMAAFPSGRQGAAGGLSFLARALGVVAGVAVTGQIVAARSAAIGFLGAFAQSLLVAALAVAGACVFALAGARARGGAPRGAILRVHAIDRAIAARTPELGESRVGCAGSRPGGSVAKATSARSHGKEPSMAVELTSKRYRVEDIDAVEFCYQQGWTDGLPGIPPTAARGAAMLPAARLDPKQELAFITHRSVSITAEKVAINAVMAGCRPEYMGVVVAAVEGIGDPAWGYHGPGTSTGGGAVLMLAKR